MHNGANGYSTLPPCTFSSPQHNRGEPSAPWIFVAGSYVRFAMDISQTHFAKCGSTRNLVRNAKINSLRKPVIWGAGNQSMVKSASVTQTLDRGRHRVDPDSSGSLEGGLSPRRLATGDVGPTVMPVLNSQHSFGLLKIAGVVHIIGSWIVTCCFKFS